VSESLLTTPLLPNPLPHQEKDITKLIVYQKVGEYKEMNGKIMMIFILKYLELRGEIILVRFVSHWYTGRFLASY